VQEHRRLRDQGPARRMVARRQLERALGQIRADPRIGPCQRLSRLQQDRDRLLVARLGAGGELRRHLDRCGAAREQHVGRLAIERSPRGDGHCLADGLADEVVAEREALAALDEHPAVDELLDRPQQRGRQLVEHRRQVRG
jgi:hypothetical protein